MNEDAATEAQRSTSERQRPTVLAVTDHYLPGYRSGGPVRSLAGWVAALGEDLDISLVCLDRDLGDLAPYAGLPTGDWVDSELCRLLYLPRRSHGIRQALRLSREISPDFIYLNNVFSIPFTLHYLVAARLTRPKPTVVLAPRGQLSKSALSVVRSKRLKKAVYLRFCQMTGLFAGVRWQASSEAEAEDICAAIGSDVDVAVAPNLRIRSSAAPESREKSVGHLRVVFLSRISPMKNLELALDVMNDIRGAIEFTIVGPVGDEGYWRRCQELIARLPDNISVAYRGGVSSAEVPGLLAQHHLLFMPSHSENYGHAIIEALDAGTPVLIGDQTPWRGLEALGAGWDLPISERRGFVDALQFCVEADAVQYLRLSLGAAEAARTLNPQGDAVVANRSLFGIGVSGYETTTI